jgi:putative colanic acid biosynthesis glycosyltransferase
MKSEKNDHLPLTVVFVCRDNIGDLEKTFSSLKNLHDSISEYVIVDSSQGSEINTFCDNQNFEGRVKYLWEPASGIYHAMNSALKLVSNNDYVWFLNPGDVLIDENVARTLVSYLIETDSIWGYGQSIKTIGSTLEVFPVKNFNYDMKNLVFGQAAISHQAMFCRAQNLVELGGFDEKLRIAADLKIQILLFQKYEPVFHFIPFVKIDPNGISHSRIFLTFFETLRVRWHTRGISKIRVIISVFDFIATKTKGKVQKSIRSFLNEI